MAWDVIDSHVRKDGFECTITKNAHGKFDVDMWDTNDHNHWNKLFDTEEKAREEFNKWKD